MELENIKDSVVNKKIFVFGTGSVYEKYRDFIKKYHFRGFIDNNVRLFDSIKDGVLIYDPQKFTYTDEDFIIIMSSYIEEISKQLETYNLIYGKDYCTFVDLDNCFNLHRIVEPGHFYSPVPNTAQIFSKDYQTYGRNNRYLGIDLNIHVQEEFVQRVNNMEGEFADFLQKNNELYYLNNGYFEYVDSITYFTLINNFRPKKIIEVGSGFTSALALGASKRWDLETDFTFIEPYPDRIKKLLTEQDHQGKLIEDCVQNVPVTVFEELNENDILFIDSSHVSKVDSDVNYLFFEILPLLKKGTIIHIHDIFSRFEYPLQWTYSGRHWNENYILRAFLQYNNHFEILCFNHFIFDLKKEDCYLDKELIKGDYGGSIWLRKLQ